MDLDGEGMSGILTEQAEGWFYKRNLSPASRPAERIRQLRADRTGRDEASLSASAADGAVHGSRGRRPTRSGDLEGPRPASTSAQMTTAGNPSPFESPPNLDWRNPNLRFVDLTGDGHADILITEDEAFCWHPSLAEEASAPPRGQRGAGRRDGTAPRLRRPHAVHLPGGHERRWPDRPGSHPQRRGLLLAEPGLRPFRRQGDDGQCAPVRPPDQFDQRRIRLADIDGSGATDIIYSAAMAFDLYFNQSGNGWSEAQTTGDLPRRR